MRSTVNAYAPEGEQGGAQIAVSRCAWGWAGESRMGQTSRSIIQNRGSTVTEMQQQ